MHVSLQLFSNLVAVLCFKRDDNDQLAHCKSVTLRRPAALIQIKAATYLAPQVLRRCSFKPHLRTSGIDAAQVWRGTFAHPSLTAHLFWIGIFLVGCFIADAEWLPVEPRSWLGVADVECSRFEICPQ
jgi:hypothetical protein